MNIFEMMKNVKALQKDLATVEATGRAGGDMVLVTLNGKFEVKQLTISDEILKNHDGKVVSELVKAAFRDAVQNIQRQMQQQMGATGLPSGLGNLFGNNQ